MILVKTLMLVLVAGVAWGADFSFTIVVKTGSEPPQTRKCYLKGHRMMIDSNATITISDLDARTAIFADKPSRTYRVVSLEPSTHHDSTSAQMDVKETGQHRIIGGFNTSQEVLTLDISNLPGGVRVQSESEIWYSPDIPGVEDLRAYYKLKAQLSAVRPGGRSGMMGVVSGIEERMGNFGGVPLLVITRIKVTGKDAGLVQQMNSALEGTREEWSGFSNSPIPDSLFTIPAGFQKVP